MFQGLAQFRIALLDFLEQAHVFDGDHGLGREGFEQRNLLLGERPDFDAANPELRRLRRPRAATERQVTVLPGLADRPLAIREFGLYEFGAISWM